MTKCNECGNQISTKADACPKCGARQIRTSGCAKIFLIFFLMIGAMMVLFQCSQSSDTTSQETTPRPSRPPISAAERAANVEASRKSRTTALVEQLKTLPEAMYQRNRDLYKQLVTLNPENVKYQERFEYYERMATAAEKFELPIPRSMAGDKGRYFLLEKKKTGFIVRAVNKRVGVDTVGYTITETNCKTMLMREIGYSEVSVAAIARKPTKWFELVPGSSKSDLANFVCN